MVEPNSQDPNRHSQVADDRLLTSHEVGAMLGISAATLRNWRSVHGADRLPFVKLNARDARYRRSTVLAFIAEREAATAKIIRDAAERRRARSQAETSVTLARSRQPTTPTIGGKGVQRPASKGAK